MCKKLIWLNGLVVLALAGAAPVCSAAVGPVTSITTDNPPGSPPYNILSITVGSYTVTADQLGTGKTTHGGIGGTPCPEMDDWDINTALDWNLGGGNFWTINFGGGPWKNSNGDDPDFFLFEYGGSQTPDIAAILPGGGLGQTVTIPDQWAGLGYSRVAAASGDPVSGSGNGQSLEGMSWAITDLLDAAGNPLTNSSVIEGIAIVNRNGIDPVGFFAVTPPPVQAQDPNPADGATDVRRDVVLSWMPGQTAQTHDVYFGTVFTDVNDADRANPLDMLVRQGQSANAYDPDGLLEFEQTHYWRIDEVAVDGTVYKGAVWSFTTEPVGYPVDGANIIATASSVSEAIFGPEKTIDGSGLDENSLHSIEPTDMWLSGNEPQGAWIQYELDRMYKLHEMWVWNSNQIFESLFGFGMKDVTVEYSTDGITWAALTDVPEFARASGAADYAHDTTVDFGGVVAKYVRLTASSNWGGVLPQYGLSEVRFFFIPVSAREPSPDSGATDVDVEATLAWRAGREAATHNVYLSTNEQAVIDGNAPVNAVADASYSPSPLDLGSTYYWRIDEVNDAETPT
ncbi:MAG: discoidin domain-containing protein, partial [Phycisphaerales bacterium]